MPTITLNFICSGIHQSVKNVPYADAKSHLKTYIKVIVYDFTQNYCGYCPIDNLILDCIKCGAKLNGKSSESDTREFNITYGSKHVCEVFNNQEPYCSLRHEPPFKVIFTNRYRHILSDLDKFKENMETALMEDKNFLIKELDNPQNNLTSTLIGLAHYRQKMTEMV